MDIDSNTVGLIVLASIVWLAFGIWISRLDQRFNPLDKVCPPNAEMAVWDAAAEQHREFYAGQQWTDEQLLAAERASAGLVKVPQAYQTGGRAEVVDMGEQEAAAFMEVEEDRQMRAMG